MKVYELREKLELIEAQEGGYIENHEVDLYFAGTIDGEAVKIKVDVTDVALNRTVAGPQRITLVGEAE